MIFTLGQRIITTVDAPAAWPGAHSAPAGTGGTITGLPTTAADTYGVLLDGDPDQMPAAYWADELTAP
ncbi:hypothetical protein [Streptomyces fulvorobeus]|uniref:Uncharacterized protein n=1 Tax=Streptomyces fulvorobeus TaxID=284028 RepID=A0A7J0C511_9ACTN|nr:hypothetical protein [Streptomyces fulvorobeus]NYE40721.1 hypothetical protein [Streptomyces fulvorobeus]GFM97024.1 hypothetical protein Sfulv_18350 [Streptomyces fulvorobeus]